MASIEVYAGTYLNQPIKFNPETQTLLFPSEKSFFKGESLSVSEIEMIEIATEENVKQINPAWNLSKAKRAESRPSTAGYAFGIAAIGLELLTKGIRVTFVAKIKNRQPILATTNEKTFDQLRTHLQK